MLATAISIRPWEHTDNLHHQLLFKNVWKMLHPAYLTQKNTPIYIISGVMKIIIKRIVLLFYYSDNINFFVMKYIELNIGNYY